MVHLPKLETEKYDKKTKIHNKKTNNKGYLLVLLLLFSPLFYNPLFDTSVYNLNTKLRTIHNSWPTYPCPELGSYIFRVNDMHIDLKLYYVNKHFLILNYAIPIIDRPVIGNDKSVVENLQKLAWIDDQFTIDKGNLLIFYYSLLFTFF